MTTIEVGELSLSCTFGAGGDDGLEIVHDARDWLKEENWTLPICSKEITDPTNVKTSRQYMECKLAELYTATQEEFRYALQGIFIKPEETNQHKDTLDEKLSIAGEVYQHLQSTKTALERQSEDFWSIYVMLNLAVRKLVRIYSPSDLIRQIRVMALRLDEPFVSIDEGESFFLSGLEDEINACEQEASINEKIDELGKKIDSLANPIITLGQGGQHGHDKQEDFKHVLIKLRRMIKEGNRASLIVARCRELLYEANDTYLIAWYKHHSEISQQVPRIWKWLGDKGWGDIGISEVLRRSVRCGCGSDYYRFDFILNKYMWIRTEFEIQLKNHLGTWPINVNVMPHAEQILYQLKVAREALQYSSSSDLDRASLALELAAASMIWVCPPSRLCSMITKEVSRLQNSTITEKEQYLQDLSSISRI